MGPGQVSLFVSIVEAGVYVTATPVLAVAASGLTGPALLILTAAMTAALWGLSGLSFRERRGPLLPGVLLLAGAAGAGVGGPRGAAAGGWRRAGPHPPRRRLPPPRPLVFSS